MKPQVTRKQLRVMAYAAQGLRNDEIAEVMGISPNTVKAHMAMLFKIFRVRNRTALTRVALTQGYTLPNTTAVEDRGHTEDKTDE